MNTFAPRDEQDALEVVTAAIANATPLAIEGGGSRSGLGRVTKPTHTVSTKALDGIIAYEPSELVLTAKAGTPLRTITSALAENGQDLAFEPIDHGPLYGHPPDGGTIGGVIATNASGPRRLKAGAARDHLLGFRAVNGRAEVFQSGGRVMKNVTGYDMCKLMAGAFGTLGLLTELSVKVLPKAESQATLVLFGLADQDAVAAMTYAMNLPQEVSGAAHFPVSSARFRSALPDSFADRVATVLRLEGSERSIAQRYDDLVRSLRAHLEQAEQPASAEFERLDAETSEDLWMIIRDCRMFTQAPDAATAAATPPATTVATPPDALWRISTAPSEGARLVEDLKANHIPVDGLGYDWSGGLIWFATPNERVAQDAEIIRKTTGAIGGHAMLVRSDADTRDTVPVFHPQADTLAQLSERVKRGFDPELILNRGRMRSDI